MCTLKVHIAKVGKAEITEFVNSRRPAWLKKEDAATSLLSHLDTKGEKSTILGFVKPRDRPRYVKGRLPRTAEGSC